MRQAGASGVRPVVLWLPLSVVLGLVAGVAAIGVHRSVVGLLLAAAASTTTLLALRQWSARLGAGFTVGWLAAMSVAVLGRSEGGYVIVSDVLGIGLVATGLVLLLLTVLGARPRRDPPHTRGPGGR